MKKILSVFSIVFVLFSCSQNNPNPTNPTNPSNPTSPSLPSWSFKITTGGVTYEAAGTRDDYPYSVWSNSENTCGANSSANVYFNLSDKSDVSYISGDVFSGSLDFPNLSLGMNDVGNGLVCANVSTDTSSALSGIYSLYYSFTPLIIRHDSVQYELASGNIFQNNAPLKINITSLGTQTTQAANGDYIFGSNIEGNGSDTYYFSTGFELINGVMYYKIDKPVSYSIEFSAYRKY